MVPPNDVVTNAITIMLINQTVFFMSKHLCYSGAGTGGKIYIYICALSLARYHLRVIICALLFSCYLLRVTHCGLHLAQYVFLAPIHFGVRTVWRQDILAPGLLAPGQFYARNVWRQESSATGQFGTRTILTILRKDSFAAGNFGAMTAWRQDRLAPGQFSARTIWW